jgi:putative pyruvate formate lyase activating enzyme
LRSLVYNCGGYESTDTLRLLNGIVVIKSQPLKYMDSDTAQRLSDAPEYTTGSLALKEMHRQVGGEGHGPLLLL